jgi:hypothetical protein
VAEDGRWAGALDRLASAAGSAEQADIEHTATTSKTSNNGERKHEQPFQTYYPSMPAWVAGYLADVIRRPERPNRVWCPQWWQHDEAIDRLEALWRAWEHLRLDGTTGMSIWWRDHADHHLDKLCDSDGPFSRCRKGHVGEHDPLPVEDVPEGFFADRDDPPPRPGARPLAEPQ